MHVLVRNRGHLQFLNAARPAAREHDEDVDARMTTNARNRGAARVPARCTEDIQGLATATEDVLEEIAKELKRDILEGKRRSVEQLEHMQITYRDRRCDVRMVETRVAPLDDRRKIFTGNVVAEAQDDLQRELWKRKIAPIVEACGNVRNHLRNQQAAIRRQSCKDSVLERHGSGLTAGADVTHGFSFAKATQCTGPQPPART